MLWKQMKCASTRLIDKHDVDLLPVRDATTPVEGVGDPCSTKASHFEAWRMGRGEAWRLAGRHQRGSANSISRQVSRVNFNIHGCRAVVIEHLTMEPKSSLGIMIEHRGHTRNCRVIYRRINRS